MSRANPSNRKKRLAATRVALVGLITGLAVLSQTGCSREFFRQWADQDVSEAVYEKTRDPRWFMDTFSIEPPALSRFADPYDPDRQPAPPDDRASEALSPTPQWPVNRLLVPAEGTGYIDLLRKGAVYKAPPAPIEVPAIDIKTQVPQIIQPPAPPGGASPFKPGENSGPGGADMSPNSLPELPPTPPAAMPRPGGNGAGNPPQAKASSKDTGVLLAAYQAPVQPGATQQPGFTPLNDRTQSPKTELDPGSNLNISGPGVPIIQDPKERKEVVKDTTSFAAMLSPGLLDFNEANATGFGSKDVLYVMTPTDTMQMALINSRAYQYHLENLYSLALSVTLQRFSFQPQFYAGAGPLTPPLNGNGGAFPLNFQNSFAYRTNNAIGGQASTLSLGTVAGFGKLLSMGGRIVGGFANQTVFNFIGSNPRQPSVASYLPLTITQPFLRGAGRAVTLEALTAAERNLVYEARNMARFRQQFMPYVMASALNVDVEGNVNDPNIGFLNVLQQIQDIENDRRTVVAYERLFKIYQEYAKGSASSGISQIQVDQVAQNLQTQRQQMVSDEIQYRQAMDNFKQQLGLPPDAPIILDRAVMKTFKDTFNEIEVWAARPDHNPEELPGILDALPDLEPCVVDDRLLFKYNDRGTELIPVYSDPEKLQEYLLVCERVALENRLDLMNNRGQLYDQWRQLAFTANALQGYFNVSLTNSLTTSPLTTNPAGFLENSRQFSLVLNTELPLIRLSERNNYRSAQIGYRQKQRALMAQEDQVKYSVRNEVYNLIQIAQTYEFQKVNLFVTIRQRDTTLQTIIAPPESSAGVNAAQQATQTNNLIQAISQIRSLQNQLVQFWVSFQTIRMSFYRDLGTMPIDEWESFYEFFPTNPTGSKPVASDGRPSPVRATDPTGTGRP